MTFVRGRRMPSYPVLALSAVGYSLSSALVLSVLKDLPGADRIFTTGGLAAIVLAVVGFAVKAYVEKKARRQDAQPDPMDLGRSVEALLVAGGRAFSSEHRERLVEMFRYLSDHPLKILPARLHPAAIGLLICQMDYLQRNPGRLETSIAGLRGGILGLATAGHIYELESPITQAERTP